MNIPTLPTHVTNSAIRQLKPICLVIAAAFSSQIGFAANDITITNTYLGVSGYTNMVKSGSTYTSSNNSAQLNISKVIGTGIVVNTAEAGANSQAGNITLSTSLNFNAANGVNRNLALSAHNDININQNINDGTAITKNIMTLSLVTDSDYDGNGIVRLNAQMGDNMVTKIDGGLSIDTNGVYTLSNSDSTLTLYYDEEYPDRGNILNNGIISQSNGSISANKILNNGQTQISGGTFVANHLSNNEVFSVSNSAQVSLGSISNNNMVTQTNGLIRTGAFENNGSYAINGGTTKITTDLAKNNAGTFQLTSGSLEVSYIENVFQYYDCSASDHSCFPVYYGEERIGGDFNNSGVFDLGNGLIKTGNLNNTGSLNVLGNGNIEGDLNNNHKLNIETGSLSVSGNMVQGINGILAFDVTGNSGWKNLSADGFNFQGGDILFNLNGITLEDFIVLASIDDFLKKGGLGYLGSGLNINDIKGLNYNANGTNVYLLDDGHFSLTAVPVPAAAWLMGSGLVGLMGIKRRKQRLDA